MKLNEKTKELLQRYLLGVKKELGGKEQEDITAEIESYIYDLLEERFADEKDISVKQLESVLDEMGAPRKVAAQYSPQRYLIGPRLFPIYWLVLKILAAVVVGGISLSLIIAAVVGNPSTPTVNALEFIGSLWSGLLSAAGAVTIVFAVIERATQGKTIEEIEELNEFKISELPELPEDEKKFSPIGISIEIALGILGILFFTYIQNTKGQVPFYLNPGSNGKMVQFFTDNFMPFVPVILALTGLDIARNITLLVQSQHSALTNWWNIGSRVANVVLNIFMISALPLVTLDFFREITSTADLARFENLANTGLGIAIGLGILGGIIEIITKSIREIRNPTY